MSYASIHADGNWAEFIAIFNRCTTFAPYTIPLTPNLLDTVVHPYMQSHSTLALIGRNEDGAGIIHAGTYAMNGTVAGHIFLFLAENNRVANALLAEAEEWFRRQGIAKAYAYTWFPNPYSFILHGRETYAWAGAFPVNNAFRRFGYDVLNDIVVMQIGLNEMPSLVIPNLSGFELRRVELGETELAWSARVEAYVDNKKIGHCEFYDLKAISSRFNKSMGQITIDTDAAYYGEGVAKALIACAHQVLYQRGNRHVMLATSQGLFRALKFYEKLGYKAELIRAYSYIKEELST